MKRRGWKIGIVLVILFGQLFGTIGQVFGAEFIGKNPNQLEVVEDEARQTRYYDLGEQEFATSEKKFVKAMLGHSYEQLLQIKTDTIIPKPVSQASLWRRMATYLQAQKGFGGQYPANFSPGSKEDFLIRAFGRARGTQAYLAAWAVGDKVYQEDKDEYTYYRKPLTNATSIKAAIEAMQTDFACMEQEKMDKFFESKAESNYEDDQLVFFTYDNIRVSSPNDTISPFMLGSARQLTGQIYYNFRAVPIIGEGTLTNTNSVPSSKEVTSKKYGSDVSNLTDQYATAEQSLQQSTSQSLTNSVSGSKTFGFEESLKIGGEVSLGGFFKASTEVSFTASQAFEKGWQEDTTLSKDEQYTSTTGITLPPYTKVLLSQQEEKSSYEMTYNCPVKLVYDVKFISFEKYSHPNLGTFIDKKQDSEVQEIADFSGDAIRDLKNRAVYDRGHKDREGLVWGRYSDYIIHSYGFGGIPMGDYSDERYKLDDSIEMLTTCLPMSSTGGKMSLHLNNINNEIHSLVPIYPLSKTQPQANRYEYDLDTNATMYTAALDVEGLNDFNAPYYGFDKGKGSWQLVDATGQAFNNPQVIQLTEDSVQGQKKLVTGDQEGIAYLKYTIDEQQYLKDYLAENSGYITNEDLQDSAIIKLKINGGEFDGQITATSEHTFIAEEEVNLNDVFQLDIRDTDGKELARMVTWDAKEKGLFVLADGTFRADTPGEYHVRATSGRVTSGWLTVTVGEKAKASQLVIEAPVAGDSFFNREIGTVAEYINFDDLTSRLAPTFYDNYQRQLTADLPTYRLCHDIDENATDTFENLTDTGVWVKQATNFNVWLEAENADQELLTSDKVTLTFTEAPRATSIHLGQPQLIATAGDTLDLNQLQPVLLDQFGNEITGATFTYQSGQGEVTGDQITLPQENFTDVEGTPVAITVSCGELSQPASLMVYPVAAVNKVALSKLATYDQYLPEKQTVSLPQRFAVTATDQFGSPWEGATVQWYSKDESIVSVTGNQAKGLKAGQKTKLWAEINGVKSNELEVIVGVPQGKAIASTKYATLTQNNVPIYQDFNGTVKGNSKDHLKRTYRVKVYYNHVNGTQYLSLYSNTDKWIGYIDAKKVEQFAKPEGKKWGASGYATILKTGYPVTGTMGGKTKTTSDKLRYQTYQVDASHQHFNGQTYYLLRDNNKQELGYVDARAVGKVAGAEGVKRSSGQYITFTKNYNFYKDFKWTKAGTSQALKGKTYRLTQVYQHFNGDTYYQVVDSRNNILGLINGKAGDVVNGRQGKAQKADNYYTVTRNCYRVYSNFNWQEKTNSKKLLGQTFKVKVTYNHANNETYLSLYDRYGKWVGYVNAKACKKASGPQGVYQSYGKQVTIKKTCCRVYQNFDYQTKASLKDLKGKTYTAKGRYVHFNGSVYYSLYNQKGKWLGYVNEHVTR